MLMRREALIFAEGIWGRNCRPTCAFLRSGGSRGGGKPTRDKHERSARRHGNSDLQLYSWRKALGRKRDGHFLPVIKDEASPRNNDGSSGSIDTVVKLSETRLRKPRLSWMPKLPLVR